MRDFPNIRGRPGGLAELEVHSEDNISEGSCDAL